jgi:hypothetical protein
LVIAGAGLVVSEREADYFPFIISHLPLPIYLTLLRVI